MIQHRLHFWIFVILGLLASGCAATPPTPVEFTDEESVEATVVAVDVAANSVTLRGPSGDDLTLRVAEARNLSQVEVGDTLRASYFTTYRASIAEPGTAESGAAITAGRAPEGERPGAFLAAGGASTIEIVSVAADGSSVSFRNENGVLDSMSVVREDGRVFAQQLKRGDLVVLEYMEAVAIEVQKTQSEKP